MASEQPQTVSISFSYEELIDLIVALRTRAELLSVRSSEQAAPYTRLANRITVAGRSMLP